MYINIKLSRHIYYIPYFKTLKQVRSSLTIPKGEIMKLLKFTIRNYRSCHLTILSPRKDLTVLIGINGSGKTNLLSAILLMKKFARTERIGFHQSSSDFINRSHINAQFEKKGKKISIRGKIYYTSDNRNIDSVKLTDFEWNIEEMTGKNRWIKIPDEIIRYGHDYSYLFSDLRKGTTFQDFHYGNILYRGSNIRKYLTEDVLVSVKNTFRFMRGISYYSASQFSDPSRCPVSLEFEDKKPSRQHLGDTINHEQFIYDLYNSYNKKTKAYQRFINVIGREGIELVDEIRFDEIDLPSNVVEVRAGGKTKKIVRKRLVVVPTFLIGGKTLSPNQLSEGTFKTLALLYYVLTDESQLLIVEEPEVCIHHGLLNSIITLIKEESRDKQIIISTHSDYVLDQIEPENVILIEKKRVMGTKAQTVTNSMGKKDFKALKEYLKKSGNLGEYWREGGLLDE